jgi:hypothetical protein
MIDWVHLYETQNLVLLKKDERKEKEKGSRRE